MLGIAYDNQFDEFDDDFVAVHIVIPIHCCTHLLESLTIEKEIRCACYSYRAPPVGCITKIISADPLGGKKKIVV